MSRIKYKILFIARNIPLPQIKGNDVIFQIADRLLSNYSIDFIYPCEWLPPLNYPNKKINYISSLKHSIKYRGFNVEILKYIRLPSLFLSYSLLFTFILMNYRKIIKYKSYHIVHAHYVLPDGYIAYYLNKKFKMPYIVSIRQGDINKINKLPKFSIGYFWYKKILKRANIVLVLNLAQKTYLKQFSINSIMIPHGIDNAYLLENHFNYDINKESINVLSVCNLDRSKNIEWCINALNQYDGNKTINYTIVGDGPEKDSLKNIRISNKRLRIIFTGEISHEDVFKYYRKNDIFILPSVNETFGLVYLEAMGNGCATIGIENFGVSGLFKQYEEAIFAKANFNDFKTKLFKLIENDELRMTISKNGYKKVETDFTWNTIILKYVDLYNSITRNFVIQ